MTDQQGGQARVLEQVLESSLESVDDAEAAILREAQQVGFDEDDLHKIGISARECLVNAVVHGNRYNAKKKVHLRVERTPDQLSITVGDEGEGFDPTAIPDPLAGENLLRHSGRGVLLMQAFMDEFEIGPRQPQGTLVKMVKYKSKISN